MSAEASSSTNSSDVLKTQYSPEEITGFNKELENKTPQEILVWAIDHLDGLYQTTAFGLCVTFSSF
jgi:phosphoadenosine phosphosulfate reductase